MTNLLRISIVLCGYFLATAASSSMPRIPSFHRTVAAFCFSRRRTGGAMRKFAVSSLLSAIACIACCAVQTANAAGYLTGLGTGVSVTSYMSNNGTGAGPTTGLTIFVSGILNPDGCGGVDKVHIKGNAVGFNEMLAMVMTAVASNKRIGFHSSGCELIPFWGGTITYPIVTDLWVVD